MVQKKKNRTWYRKKIEYGTEKKQNIAQKKKTDCRTEKKIEYKSEKKGIKGKEKLTSTHSCRFRFLLDLCLFLIFFI